MNFCKVKGSLKIIFIKNEKLEFDEELVMNIEFSKFSEFQRGIMFELLKDSYSYESRYERDWITNWKEADDFFMIIYK